MKNERCCPLATDPINPVRFALALVVSLLGALPLWVNEARAADASLQFNRDIRPILSDNCFACHGPDPGARKAGLRLDTKDGLFETTPKHGPAVVPGKPEESELWKRLFAADPDDLMPPQKSGKELKPEQKELLKQWILAGATWQGHWSFIKPERPPVPFSPVVGGSPTIRSSVVSKSVDSKAKRHRGAAGSIKDESGFTDPWIRNPIDAFVLARLRSKGLEPNPEADRRTLARRLSLDLTGLPPTPGDVENFVKDRSTDAYERLVARLFDSPHWGEHRARYWLDAARYADTHGLHFDNYREMWPYRDYVIRAFNLNRAFDRFIIEQVAGDLLENPTDDELVATGFHRCNMTTNEGGTIEEENLANYANDRVTTTGWVFLGLTTNCGACHDHKFDPFTTRDFYSMAAFFRNTTQGGFDRNRREGDLSVVMPQNEADRARWKALAGEIEVARTAREAQQEAADMMFTNWAATARIDQPAKVLEFSGEHLRLPLAEGTNNTVAGIVNGKPRTFSATNAIEWTAGGPLGPAPVLTNMNSVLLGECGELESTAAFSLGGWVRAPEDFKGEGSVLARMSGEDQKQRGWDFFVRDDHFGIYLVHRWPSVALKVRAQDKSVKRGEWHHLFVTYDGSMQGSGVKLFLDGLEIPVKRDNDSLEGSIHTAVPLRLGQRELKHELNGVAVQDARVFRRRLDASEVGALAAASRLAELLPKVEFVSTNNPARDVMRLYFRATQHQGWRECTQNLLVLEGERQMIRGRSPVAHIQRERTNSEPMAQILFRGQYDKPKDKVVAATPAALHPLPPGAPTNRLGFAQWLVSPENPLTVRVLVNRFWQEVFGVGLVKTVEDFGTMGEIPSNQALLDWMAVEFCESGWDVRHLFNLMVTSSTYRQSAVNTPEKLEKDPQNRLLSRGPRFRMDAEMVRDYALAASGLLVEKIGGPSVKPYQPEGVWEAVAMPESNTRHYERDSGEALYRRSLYTFWKRAAPPATMDLFNAPSREGCTVRRERTNTPLQALVTLNDPQFVEAARYLADTALSQSRGRVDKALEAIARRLLTRPFSERETQVVRQTLAEMEAFYHEHPDDADRLLAIGESKPSAKWPAPQLAALTMVANQLLNLDEVLNK